MNQRLKAREQPYNLAREAIASGDAGSEHPSMCGICGKVNRDTQRPIDRTLIDRMCEVITHRGPDEHGVYVDQHVGLGHRRLSIIDLSTGQQPMGNSRKDLWITYNGEIYNFPHLRKTLEKEGYRFRTHSDTEVILALYEKHGATCVDFLQGMFAFALWDQRQQRLVLARDRIGQKPLFYRLTQDSIAFASEIKSLLQDSSCQRELNLSALATYLTYQYVPAPDTMFHEIKKLPPAHILIYEQGNVTIERYWKLGYHPKVNQKEEQLIEQFSDKLQEAVEMRMLSDVPLGVFLSGGIDSSLVTALMARKSSQPIKTFSIGFADPRYDELPYARRVAQHLHSEHHEWRVEPQAIDILPKLLWHVDEPFGDPSAIPTYYLAQMTSQHVKVVLNGDGGDESFAGYARYLRYYFLRYYQVLPETVRKNLLETFFKKIRLKNATVPAWGRELLRKLQTINALSCVPQNRLYPQLLTIFQPPGQMSLFTDDARAKLPSKPGVDQMLRFFHTETVEHLVDKMLYTDVMTYLPGDLLVKMDRMTMAHGLEGRSPFLDHKLMEAAACLPPAYKLRRTQLKFLLKQIGKKWLPENIVTRKKQGFTVPIGAWISNDLHAMIHDMLTTSTLVHDGIFNHTALQRILQEHHQGQVDHRYRIWLLLILEVWYRMFMHHD